VELQGYVVVALTLILLGYLLPHLVRTRQLLLDSRVEDRFSGDLRILATAGKPETAQGRAAHTRGHTSDARPYLHDPARRPEAPMNRPRARAERATEDARALAAARAARAARVSRRAAAARRRLILTVVLLALAVGGWTAVGLAATSWVLAVVPSLLLVTVLVLGRRTAVKAAANDRRDRAEMAKLEARLKAMSRRAQATPPRRTTARSATRPTAGTTPRADREVASARTAQVDGRGEDDVEAPAASHEHTVPQATAYGDDDVEAPATARASAPSASDEHIALKATAYGEDDVEAPTASPEDVSSSVVTYGEDDVEAPEASDEVVAAHSVAPTGTDDRASDERPWTPIPVPAPSYTLKQDAPRRDVAPYETVSGPTATVPQRPTVASPAAAPAPAEEPVALTLDLDAVLARRRAAGE
jgi:hypothetical protein